jgi:hypothetical protein
VLFVVIDDDARVAFTELYPDESPTSAGCFLANSHAYFRGPERALQARLRQAGA